MTQHLYPMMIDLTGRRCLVVGGGTVAERKVASLLAGGGDVVVVSPSLTPGLMERFRAGEIECHFRPYRREDGEGCFLVIAATDQEAVNRRVYEDARARGQWINVVDRPDLCNFIVPSALRRGKLTISVSTAGASPSLAKEIRRRLESEYGPEYEVFLDLLVEMRRRIQSEVNDTRLRYRLMAELVQEEWVRLCKEDPEEAREQMKAWVDRAILEEMAVTADSAAGING
ncbi:MAG: precorrin-2 dehydrogenase/sirohydrochlorin ferrochelatase family protein [Planifilum sp.]|jgi:precorrin-2 dehydrogenase/sirohydrochlorin ferrochelatase